MAKVVRGIMFPDDASQQEINEFFASGSDQPAADIIAAPPSPASRVGGSQSMNQYLAAETGAAPSIQAGPSHEAKGRLLAQIMGGPAAELMALQPDIARAVFGGGQMAFNAIPLATSAGGQILGGAAGLAAGAPAGPIGAGIGAATGRTAGAALGAGGGQALRNKLSQGPVGQFFEQPAAPTSENVGASALLGGTFQGGAEVIGWLKALASANPKVLSALVKMLPKGQAAQGVHAAAQESQATAAGARAAAQAEARATRELDQLMQGMKSPPPRVVGSIRPTETGPVAVPGTPAARTAIAGAGPTRPITVSGKAARAPAPTTESPGAGRGASKPALARRQLARDRAMGRGVPQAGTPTMTNEEILDQIFTGPPAERAKLWRLLSQQVATP